MNNFKESAGLFAATLAEGIRPAMEEFVALPTVRPYCVYRSRYDDRAVGRSVIEGPDAFLFPPRTPVPTVDQMLSTMHNTYVDSFLFVRGLVDTDCMRRGRPVPETHQTELHRRSLLRAMSKGLAGLEEYMHLSVRLPGVVGPITGDYIRPDSVPTVLMVLAAAAYIDLRSEACVPAGHESLARVVGRAAAVLQEMCVQIRSGAPLEYQRGKSDHERLFEGAQRALYELYHRGSSRKFQKALFNSTLLGYLGPKTYDTFRKSLAASIGADFPDLTLHDLNAWFAERDAAQRRLKHQRRSDGRDPLHLNGTEMYDSVLRTHATRLLVDGLASGALRYDDFTAAIRMTQQHPLIDRRLPPPELAAETLDWTVLQPDRTEIARAIAERHPPGTPQEQLDLNRIDRLLEYARDWPDAKVAIGRPAERAGQEVEVVPGKLSIRERAYLVVILPELVGTLLSDGTVEVTVLEHAIAEAPRRNHALYLLRGEIGQRYTPRLTWREIFSQPRGDPVKALGALAFYHAEHDPAKPNAWTLYDRVLDMLTCPMEEVDKTLRRRAARRVGRLSTLPGAGWGEVGV